MNNFAGKRVLALESRRSKEIASLIASYAGQPVLAPAMREVPLESNREAGDFISRLERGEFDLVIFLTGVGTRLLAELARKSISAERFAAALRRARIVARGPKPVAALKELGVVANAVAPEPNTWRELLAVLDRDTSVAGMKGLRVAVQEYGEPAEELLAGLQARGALVTRVPVYGWALPENLEPLRAAVRALSANEIPVVLFTTRVQVGHLFQIAAEMNLDASFRGGLARSVLASIGPTTSEELRKRGLEPDLEASHPKMGILVKEAAEQCERLLSLKNTKAAR